VTRAIHRAPWQTPPPRLTLRGSTIDPELRRLVHARANGMCECCGERLGGDWQAHHRKLRSRGGQDSACNLVALHPLCHRRVHSHVKWATDHGFQVPSTEDPATYAVAVHCSAWRLLNHDGTYTDAETGDVA
jgi:hypothetical protein